MWSFLVQFYRRHRRRILWAAGSLAAGSVLLRYALARRAESIAHQQQLIHNRIKKKYQQTQQDCMYTLLALIPSLTSSIFKSIPVETITQQLLKKRRKAGELNSAETISDVKTQDDSISVSDSSKGQLWGQLKVNTLTRLMTLVYANCFLTVFVRLQLNLLARKDYLENAMEAAQIEQKFDETHDDDDYLAQQSYLSLSWWLLNDGYQQISDKCNEIIQLIFRGTTAKTEMTFNEFSTLIAKAQECIDHAYLMEDGLLERCLLPAPDYESHAISQGSKIDIQQVTKIEQHPTFRLLVEESKEYINSEAASTAIVNMVTTSFAKFLNNCSSMIFDPNSSPETIEIELITKRFKLVKILSVVAKESNKLTAASSENEYIQLINSLPELDDFTATVYSNFSSQL